jgi:hypothetical protein
MVLKKRKKKKKKKEENDDVIHHSRTLLAGRAELTMQQLAVKDTFERPRRQATVLLSSH